MAHYILPKSSKKTKENTLAWRRTFRVKSALRLTSTSSVMSLNISHLNSFEIFSFFESGVLWLRTFSTSNSSNRFQGVTKWQYGLTLSKLRKKTSILKITKRKTKIRQNLPHFQNVLPERVVFPQSWRWNMEGGVERFIEASDHSHPCSKFVFAITFRWLLRYSFDSNAKIHDPTEKSNGRVRRYRS